MHRFVGPREELFDIPRSLADTMLVLDHGDAHVAFAANSCVLAPIDLSHWKDFLFPTG